MKDETTTEQTPDTPEKDKTRDPFAALFDVIDILAEEYEKEQEETQHDD